MTNYEKIMAELQNMRIEEFAKTRIFYSTKSGFYYGDFCRVKDWETALHIEIEWLKKEVQE